VAAFAGDEPRRPLTPGIIVCLIAALAIAVVAGAAIKEVALAVALLTVFVVVWIASLLVDGRIRLVRTVFDAPLALIITAILASELANPNRVNELGTYVTKDLLFFASFLLVLYLVVSVARTRDDLDFILKVMVGGGAVIAIT